MHVHVFDAQGRQTLAEAPTTQTLRAIRAACPGLPISLSTSADIEADPARRQEQVAARTELPELVTANQGEDGIVALCELLLARGVGIEAGLLTHRDAQQFVASGLASRCVRVMVGVSVNSYVTRLLGAAVGGRQTWKSEAIAAGRLLSRAPRPSPPLRKTVSAPPGYASDIVSSERDER